MAGTLSIRLRDEDRHALEVAAAECGQGLSSYIRDLAEAEARRVRRRAIRVDGEAVTEYLTDRPEAADELDLLGSPASDLP